MTDTSFKLSPSPFFRLRVTGPDASAQEMLKDWPALMPTKEAGPFPMMGFAMATAKVTAATRAYENCILTVVELLKSSIDAERLLFEVV